MEFAYLNQPQMDTPTRPLVLTIDDEPEITELIRINLEGAGLGVLTAATADEALALTRQHQPDLILLDVMLPDVDGFGLCEILRSCEGTLATPIVMLTGCSSPEARRVGKQLGATDYLAKPFKPAELVARVKQLLADPARRASAERRKTAASRS